MVGVMRKNKIGDVMMKEQIIVNRYKDYADLPLLLGANDLIHILGLSRTNIYYLLRADNFPTITIGKRKMVHKDKFIEWLNKQEV